MSKKKIPTITMEIVSIPVRAIPGKVIKMTPEVEERVKWTLAHPICLIGTVEDVDGVTMRFKPKKRVKC